MTIETFTGLIIISCVSAYFLYRNGRKLRIANASSVFRGVFTDDYTISIYGKINIATFRDKFIIHQIAMDEFVRYLGFIERCRFNRKRKEYDDWANHILTESLARGEATYHYTYALEGGHVKTEFKNHIGSLLNFANET